jgi:hypothetical protein
VQLWQQILIPHPRPFYFCLFRSGLEIFTHFIDRVFSNMRAINDCIAHMRYTDLNVFHYANYICKYIFKNSYNIYIDHLFLKNFNVK